MSPIEVVIGGLGARGILFHTSYIAKALAKAWTTEDTTESERPRIHSFYDLQKSTQGPGNAFQLDCDASLNTGLPGPIPIETTGLSSERVAMLNRLTDLAGRYSELLMVEEPSSILARLRSRNINSAICFAQASKSGVLETSVACGPRNLVGEALIAMRDEATDLASKHLPWLQVKIHLDCEIVDINVDDRLHPVLSIKFGDSDKVQVLPPCDLFIKATGTTWTIPVQGEEQRHAYTSIPKAVDGRAYISQLGWFAENSIKPGLRLLVGGTGLSALDHIGVVLAMTSIVQVNEDSPDGFEVNEHEASKYTGLFTMFSRTESNVVPPRYDATKLTMPESPIITREMLLAVRLQEDRDPISDYVELARVQVAIQCQKFPSEVFKTTIFNREEYQSDSNDGSNDRALISEAAMFQRLITSMLLSCTTAPQFDGNVDVGSRFPLLRRHPLEEFRMMSNNATHSKNITWAQNEKHSDAIRIATNFLAAAPQSVILLLAKLLRLGVVVWEKLSYEAIRWDSEERCFKANGKNYHGLFASRIYTIKADSLWKKLEHALPDLAPGKPVFKKGRFLQNKAGDLVHVVDLGLSGHGRQDGRHLLHAQWNDTNTYAAVQQLMPSVAMMVSLFEWALSHGIQRPGEWISQLEHAIKPSQDQFSKQLELLRRPYCDLVEYMNTARLLAEILPDGQTYAKEMGEIKTMDDCRRIRRKFSTAEHATKENSRGQYHEALETAEFRPMDERKYDILAPDFHAGRLVEVQKLLKIMEMFVSNVVVNPDKGHSSAQVTAFANKCYQRGDAGEQEHQRLTRYLVSYSRYVLSAILATTSLSLMFVGYNSFLTRISSSLVS